MKKRLFAGILTLLLAVAMTPSTMAGQIGPGAARAAHAYTATAATAAPKYTVAAAPAAKSTKPINLGKNKAGYSVVINDTASYTKSSVQKTVDSVIKKFPDGLMKTCSEYFRKHGLTCQISFETPSTSNGVADGLTWIDRSGVHVQIMNDTVTGEVLAHELAHVLHLYLENLMWEKRIDSFEKEWTALNGELKYLGDEWIYLSRLRGTMAKAFVSVYATLDYYEDFAETVSFYYYKPDAIANLIEEDTPIARKVELAKSIILAHGKVKKA